MAFRVVLTGKAEADVDSVLKWFADQRATDASARGYAQFMARLNTLANAAIHLFDGSGEDGFVSVTRSVRRGMCGTVRRVDLRSGFSSIQTGLQPSVHPRGRCGVSNYFRK